MVDADFEDAWSVGTPFIWCSDDGGGEEVWYRGRRLLRGSMIVVVADRTGSVFPVLPMELSQIEEVG